MTENTLIVGIDPGISGTGFAFVYYRKFGAKLQYYSTEVKSSTKAIDAMRSKKDWTRIISEMSKALYAFSSKYKHLSVDRMVCVIEIPHTWVGSSVSVSASTTGGLSRNAFLAGVLVSAIHPALSTNTINIQAVLPQEWKGQLPKDVVKKRVEINLGISCSTLGEHEIDALGMCCYGMGSL